MASVNDTKAAFVAAAGAVKPSSKKGFAASKASDQTDDWYKILGYGHSGMGKTKAIEGFLKAGLRVFVATTDIGGSGLRTVKTSLKDDGRADLLENLADFDFTDYEDFEAWLQDPNLVRVEGKPLWDWKPDMLCWEGASNWQECHLGDYVLSKSPSGKASELREAGLFADQQDWGAIRKGTLRCLNNFLLLHRPDRKVHKYVTTLEDNSKQDKLTGEVYKGPLIMGAARSYMAPAFDLIVEMSVKKAAGGAPEYVYKCGASSNTLSKRRGLNVKPEEPADMEALWRKITGGVQ